MTWTPTDNRSIAACIEVAAQRECDVESYASSITTGKGAEVNGTFVIFEPLELGLHCHRTGGIKLR